MNKVVVYKSPNGNASILGFPAGSQLEGETEEQAIARIMADKFSNIVDFKIINREDLPDPQHHDSFRYDSDQGIVIDVDLRKVLLKAQVEAKRLAVETGGITWNGMQIFTDHRSQTILTSALLLVVANSWVTADWKVGGGTVEADTTFIQGLSAVMFEWVKECYAVEKAKLLQVADNEIPDLESGWPDTNRV